MRKESILRKNCWVKKNNKYYFFLDNKDLIKAVECFVGDIYDETGEYYVVADKESFNGLNELNLYETFSNSPIMNYAIDLNLAYDYNHIKEIVS